jgi:putative hemolysin
MRGLGFLSVFGFAAQAMAQGEGTLWVSSSQEALAVALLVVLLVFNALFHAAEAALAGIRSSRLRDMVEARDPRADRLRALQSQAQSYYAVGQVGRQVCRAGIYAISALLAPPISESITRNSDHSGGRLIVETIVVVFLVAVFNLAFVELFFRGLARKNPEAWAARLSGLFAGSRIILSPLVWLMTKLSSFFSKRLGIGPLFSPPLVTEEDLRELVDASGASGELIEDEKEMIHSIIEFTDTVAREVMTPRTEIDALEKTATCDDVARLIQETGHTRIPIYDGTIDRIVGIVHAKDVLKLLLERNGKGIGEIIRPALFIPESKDLHQLLTEFRRNRTLMAIVQDEFGGTAGLVTIEDLVEEIVGEIVDEYDVEEPEVLPVGTLAWLIDGRTHLDDVNDEIDSSFESEEFDTIGGYLFGLFGRQPAQGEFIDAGDWHLEVAETDGRRVMKVLVRRQQPVA